MGMLGLDVIIVKGGIIDSARPVEQIDVDMFCIVPDVKFKCAISKRKSMRICGCCLVNDMKNENCVTCSCVVCNTSFHRKFVPVSFFVRKDLLLS